MQRVDYVFYRFLRLQPVASYVDHSQLIGFDGPAVRQVLQSGYGDSSGRFGEDSFGFGQKLDTLNNVVFGDSVSGTVGLAQYTNRVDAVGRIADGQGLGDGVGPDRRYVGVPVSPSGHDRRAANGLSHVHLGGHCGMVARILVLSQ